MWLGAADPSPYPSRPTMSWLKKSKKSLQPFKRPAPSGVPAHVPTGPLGFSATLDLNVNPEGALHSIKIWQPMGLIQFLRQVKTMEGTPKSHFCPGEARISRFTRRVLQPGLGALSMRIVSEVGVRFAAVFEIHPHDSDGTARTRT